MPDTRISRRDAIRLALAAGAAASQPAYAAAPAWQEAPALAEAAKQGKLPALAQRLPKNPEIVQPTAGVGRYGSVMRTSVRGDADHNAILRIIGNMGLTRWSPADPKRYRVVIKSGEDQTEEMIGFRTIQVRGTQLLLNGHLLGFQEVEKRLVVVDIDSASQQVLLRVDS